MKSASIPPQRRDAEAAAKALGVRLVSLDVGSPEQLGKAFEAYAGEHVDWVRGGPGCLNRFSASISGASAGVRLPSGVAAG